MISWICDKPLDLAPIGTVYDTLHIGDQPPLQLSRPIEAQKFDLMERFPDESKAIDAWFNALEKGQDALFAAAQVRSMPRTFGAAVKWWNHRGFKRYCDRTTAEVVSDITDNPHLAKVFFSQWGDFGGRPSTASFAIHAAVLSSYVENGAYYPVGSAASIAEHMLPAITSGDSEARSGVEVTSLIMEDDELVGVETAEGEKIYAAKVVSNIGARETIDRLLPDGHNHQDWVDEIHSIGFNICHYSLFLGFAGDVEAAGMTKSNHWLYPNGEVDAVWTTAPEGIPPGMFVSFASMKDPAHDPGPDQKYAGEIMTWSDWSTVERFADLPRDQRGEDYQAFKQKIEDVLFEQFTKYFPRLAELVVFREVSTPLATASFTSHIKGSFYGLDVTPKRIGTDALRMKTPIKGLFLTGQDVVTPVIPGALWSGILTAGSIDPKVFMHMA